ncbi:TPA: hypothetical protein I7777_17165 [Vibrio vulnificus]|nr:hypothetical protein [Vibrio vulnificus]
MLLLIFFFVVAERNCCVANGSFSASCDIFYFFARKVNFRALGFARKAVFRALKKSALFFIGFLGITKAIYFSRKPYP